MNLGIMQPYFFPYIGYFQLIHAVDKFIMYDWVNFRKKGWINRNKVLQKNIGETNINVPLKKKSSSLKIYQIEIDNSVDWQNKIALSLWHNYRRAPFFQEIYPFISNLLLKPYDMISMLNFESIKSLCELLGIRTPIVHGNCEPYISIEKELIKEDFFIERKVHRIISICKQEKANKYINAIGGQMLYDKCLFEENGIILQFIKSKDILYDQRVKPFYPNMSIIDVLMNCGVEKTKQMVTYYDLI